MAIFDVCHPSQHIYRTLLLALSHPGRCYTVSDLEANTNEDPILHRIASCLMDHEVSFALSAHCEDALRGDLVRKTGARPTVWARADFIFIAGGDSDGLVVESRRGSLAYPDHGATLIYYLDSTIDVERPDTAHHRIRLSGPGIQRPIPPGLAGPSLSEYGLLRDINGDYPMGVDVFVIRDNRHIMGLPRSTRIEVE